MSARILFACIASALAVATAAAQRPTPFRSSADMVALTVTVSGSGRDFVEGLGAADFSVFEDGVEQTIALFSPRQEPIALSLLIDRSGSMEHVVPALKVAARGFVRRLRPQDLAEIVGFNRHLQTLQPFTPHRDALERAIDRLTMGGDTALFNAMYITLRGLAQVQLDENENVHARRRGLIVFSDGKDTASLMAFEDVLDFVKRSDATLYAISIRDGPPDPRNRREGEYILRALAEESGGRAFVVDKAEDLTGVYARVGDELATQYVVGYTSTNPAHDGTWRRVDVRLVHPNMVARTRKGYFAPTTATAAATSGRAR